MQDLKNITDTLNARLSTPEVDQLSQAKQLLDTKIERQQYAYIAKHKREFEDIQDRLEEMNSFLKEKVQTADDRAKDLFCLSSHSKADVYSKIHKIVSDIITIDKKKLFKPGQSIKRGRGSSILPYDFQDKK